MNVKVQIANVKSSPNCKTQMNVTLNLFQGLGLESVEIDSACLSKIWVQ